MNNVGTLTGDIYVNSGQFGITGASTDTNSATSTTAADLELGNAGNRIILNGGTLFATESNPGPINHHQILVGPAGGTITGGTYGVTQWGSIGDLDPSNPGTLYWHSVTAESVNTFSGTSVFTGPIRFEGNSNIGTGPIVITNGGMVNVYNHTGDLNCQSSAMTIVGTGTLMLSSLARKSAPWRAPGLCNGETPLTPRPAP